MWEALHASMLRWYRLIGAGSEGARTLERDGLVAALVAGTVAAAGLAALIAARQPDLMAFAQHNTAFLAVASAIGLTAAALLGAWAGVLARRR